MKKLWLKLWFWIVCGIVLALGIILLSECNFHSKRHTKDEAIQQVCKKYGHTWGEWRLEGGSNPLITISPDSSWLREWFQRCQLCGETEEKFSASDKTPDATRAMVVVAKDVAERLIEKHCTIYHLSPLGINFASNIISSSIVRDSEYRISEMDNHLQFPGEQSYQFWTFKGKRPEKVWLVERKEKDKWWMSSIQETKEEAEQYVHSRIKIQ